MRRYRCHKEVWAVKIFAIGLELTGGTITPEDIGVDSFRVSQEYLTKHRPEPGGYFVVYADGYQSFSPAKAFEEGYSKI